MRKEELWVIKLPFLGNAETVLVDGKGMFSGKPREYYEKNDDYEILKADDFFKKLEEYNENRFKGWLEVTEDKYEYALCVLPPLRWKGNSFFLGECITENYYHFYTKLNGKFYSAVRKITEPLKSILADLDNEMKHGEIIFSN
jgi:hypothetical protein